MKKLLALIVCAACAISCFVGCVDNGEEFLPTPTETEAGSTSTPTSVATPTETADSSAEATPTITPTLAPGETPKPTPTPTPRPAQTESIVPYELLITGYTEPLPPETVDFPKNYNMPYYLECDITNQCVNVFVKNEETGAYDVLLNRFVCSAGTSDQPTKLGHFFIKTDAQEGRKVKNEYYYFQKYESHAYYITRYSGAYMFHSFTYTGTKGAPKKGAYYNMGNPGSAGCLRMLMGHAKWIYENIDPGTYVVVNKNRPVNRELRDCLLKYVPPLGWDMTPDWKPGDNTKGLVRADHVPESSVASTLPPVTPTPTATPEVTVAPTTPAVTPTATAVVTPAHTAKPTAEPTATSTSDDE